MMKSSRRVVYTARPDTSPDVELDALSNVFRFIFDCHAKRKAAEPASEPDGRNDAAIVRHKEEMSHVKQRIR
jgi:hypothetical protein